MTTWQGWSSAARSRTVIAIAAGVVEGLGIVHHNAMAAHHAQGLVEMSRLACAEGSRRESGD